ncbi:MAG: hypothetical protein WCJ57_03930 [Candidatus Falkowbacteria bacterium]
MRKYLKARHEKHYKNSKFHLVADITFVFVIILLFVAFILISSWRPKMNIVMESQALSEQVKSGNLESFELSYHASKATTNNSLAMKLPDGFILDSVEPTENFDKSANTFYLNDLEKGSNGKIKITGLVLGEVGSKSDFAFTFNCSQCSTGILQSLPYEIKSSVLDVNVDLPETVYRGVEFTGNVKVKNNGPKELINIKAKINDSWQIKGGNELSLDKIGSGEEKIINFFAITNSDKNGEALSLDYYLNVNNKLLKQGSYSQDLNIKTPNFKVFIDADKKSASINDEVVYVVKYQNQEDVPLSDIKFNLISGNSNYKISNWSLVGSDSKVKNQNGSLVLDGSLEPDKGGQFSIKVKYARVKAAANQEVYLDLNNNYTLNGQSLKYNLSSPKTKLASQLKVKSGAYYYSSQGDQLGVGPLPPQVGMATNYWIFWELENSGNDLENLAVSADVPDSAVWMDNKSLLAGTLRHAEIGGRVIWEVPTVNSQTERGQYRAGFSLGVIPEDKDLGKTLLLLQNVRYTAFDKFTGQEISGSLKDLSTSLESDILSSGKGTVIAAD